MNSVFIEPFKSIVTANDKGNESTADYDTSANAISMGGQIINIVNTEKPLKKVAVTKSHFDTATKLLFKALKEITFVYFSCFLCSSRCLNTEAITTETIIKIQEIGAV